MKYPETAKANRKPIESTGTSIIVVSMEHHVAEARQKAKAIAEQLGFKRSATYEIATSVTELANNLIFHTNKGGTIMLREIQAPGRVGLEVISIDAGPGIKNVQEALRDGFTTNGGLGSGLPGVGRLMDDLHVESKVDIGTQIIARKWRSCL